MPKIRRVIHFIWAGGVQIMPPKSIKVVSDWAKANKNFQVWIWVDNATWYDQNKTIVQKYKEELSKEGVSLVYEENIPEGADQQPNKTCAPIITKDIHKAGLRDEYVAYELDKLRPNYGASSDLLRYTILYHYGGAYFDSDVANYPDFSLETIKFGERKHHVLYFDHLSQEMAPQVPVEPEKVTINFPKPGEENYEVLLREYVEKQTHYAEEFLTYAKKLQKYKENQILYLQKLKNFVIDDVGNDTFICTKNNPLMLEILKKAKSNYSYSTEADSISLAHRSRYVRDITIWRTGPMVVSDVVNQFDHKVKQKRIDITVSNMRVMLFPVRTIELQLTSPLINTLGWMKPRLIRHNGQAEKAMKLIENTINFEAKHFRILRLDDHISDFSQSCKVDSAEVTLWIIEYLDRLEKTQADFFKNIIFAQYTFQYPELLSFYKAKNIASLGDGKTARDAKSAIVNETNLPYLVSIKENKELRERNFVVRRYCRYSLKEGKKFIECLVKNLSVFDLDVAKEICGYLLAPLERNGIIAVFDSFNSALKVNSKTEISDLSKQIESFNRSLTKTEDKSAKCSFF